MGLKKIPSSTVSITEPVPPRGSSTARRRRPDTETCRRGRALHTLSGSPLAAHLGGCAPPSLTALRWREMSKMAAWRAAPARDADTGTPRRDARRPASSSVPLVPALALVRDDARDDARVALSVPPGRGCSY